MVDNVSVHAPTNELKSNRQPFNTSTCNYYKRRSNANKF